MSIGKIIRRLFIPKLARQVQAERLTYLTDEKLISLAKEIKRVRKDRVPGDFYELGVALGGSAIYIASELDPDRRFVGFDVFGMIPPPSERDADDTHTRYKTIVEGRSIGIGSDQYYGYLDNLYEKVVGNFKRFGLPVDGQKIELRGGLFDQTLRAHDRKVAFAHIDCDWYDPVHFCISTISPMLSRNAIIIVDDYNDYKGCRDAVDTCLRTDHSLKIERQRPHAVLRKVT